MKFLILMAALSSPNSSKNGSNIELGKAPPKLEWRSDLPAPELRPDGSVVLRPETAAEIVRHLKYGDSYPDLCQAALDAQGISLTDTIKTQELELKAAEKEKGLPLWVIILTGTAGVLVGTIIGVDIASHR